MFPTCGKLAFLAVLRPKKKQKKRKNREKFEINGKKPLILDEKRGRFFKTKQFFNRSLSGTERVESRE